MLDPKEELRRKLDEVVGKRYAAPAERGVTRRRFARWLLASLCAIGAVATILWTIESHRLPKEMPRRVDKPVSVTIVPAKPP